MDAIHDLPLFVLAGLLLNLTPGADTLYVTSQAAARGVRAGMVAALGIGAGCLGHILAAAVGLSALLTASATAFAIVKWLGALYLIYLGITLLVSGSPRAHDGAPAARRTVRPDRHALESHPRLARRPRGEAPRRRCARRPLGAARRRCAVRRARAQAREPAAGHSLARPAAGPGRIR
jgi:hypothetical protein